MGKKGYNWKARQSFTTKVDDSETQKISVDLPTKEYGGEDSSNALVLPSSKRHTKVKKDTSSNVRILSKQQRKKLEKIVEKKQKKENRASLLEALAKVQVNVEELNQMTSISAVQSKGLKKNLRQADVDDIEYTTLAQTVPIVGANDENVKIKTIAGSRKRKHLLTLESRGKTKRDKKDYNVVGLEASSSGSDVSDIEMDEEPEEEKKEETIDKDENLLSLNEKMQIEEAKGVILDEEELKRNAEKLAKKNKKKRHDRVNIKDDSEKIAGDKLIVMEKRETIFIQVDRDPKIQAARLKLPILGEEQAVVECINENAIVLIAGETGSGKTTQVPQFLYEAGYTRNKKMIGVTEPRRVAAVAMAERVATEMSLTSREVSYLMRYEGNVTEDTQIKFMTDGVLLKEVESDFTLSKYSVIIIDEAHERSVFTDILIGLLSRIVPLRCKRGDPLRLVIMSATLRIEDFTENTRLFRVPPPVIKIEARQFPVTLHFNKRTDDDYLKSAFSKTIKIHTTLPEGGILVFVTGQQEVNTLVKRLRMAFPLKKYTKKLEEAAETTSKDNPDKSKPKSKRKSKSDKETESKKKIDENLPTIDITDEIGDDVSNNTNDVVIKDEDSSDGENVKDQDDEEQEMRLMLKKEKKLARDKKRSELAKLPKFDLDDFDLHDEEVEDDMLDQGEQSDIMDDSDDENEWDSLALAGASATSSPLWVLPLYSMLPPAEQSKVFAPPPPGCRLCVISTNVAETSLTIPDIKYVVDSGKQKTRVYEKMTGASAMRVVWTSHAAAQQRAGRAGRVAPGHCYRLYSSAVYQHDMPANREPEIRARPVDDLLLQMKCMGIDKVINFPFPSAPDLLQLKTAEMRLEILGALEKSKTIVLNSKFNKKNGVTPEEILKVTPLGKAIAAYPVLPRYGKMLALSHQHNLFEYTICIVAALSVQEVLTGRKKKWTATGEELLLGDPGALMSIVGAAEYAALSGQDMEAWCLHQGVRHRALREIRLLGAQLAGTRGSTPSAPSKPPGALARPLRQLMLAGLGDCVARKVDLKDVKQKEDKIKLKHAYHCADMEEPVFMHSGSVLRKELPEWVVFQELYEAGPGGEGESAKMIIRGITAIEPEWLPIFVPKLCNFGEPLLDPSPRYDVQKDKILCHVNATFSRSAWPLPTCEIAFPRIPDIHRWFAVFLLEGLVVPKLRKYAKSLISPPLTMVKSWAKLQPRTELMHRSLVTNQISSKKGLVEEWQKNPSYLLEAYKSWLPESAHDELTLFWPPLEK